MQDYLSQSNWKAERRAGQSNIAKTAADRLLSKAVAKGSTDNITVLVLLLPWY